MSHIRPERLFFAALIWIAFLPLSAHADNSNPTTARRGYAVPIGGGVSEAIWKRLVELAGGNGARFVVFGTAAGDPEEESAWAAAELKRHGAMAEVIPVTPQSIQDDERQLSDPSLIKKIRSARGVFFSGGSQGRIVDTLAPGGRKTPLLEAIWQVYRNGGVVAGESAGAAIMSRIMFREGSDLMQILKGRLRDGVEVDKGLGFVGPGLFVDQHFLKRGRIGRMLPLMLSKGYRVGLGVDEYTAAVIHHDEIEILGDSGALLVDLSDASSDEGLQAFNVKNARLSYLDPGDRYNLRTHQIHPSPEKLVSHYIDPNSVDFSPYFHGNAFYIDILADTTIVKAMGRLLSSDRQELKGLAYDPPSDEDDATPELGFEFHLRKGADSLGWYSGGPSGIGYTIANIYLDVNPVRLSQPLYTSWQS
jgi:cyanophycinase